MRLYALLLFVFFWVSKSFITYDSNQVINSFPVNSIQCLNNANFIQTYSFSGEFENIPQMFFSLEYADQCSYNVTISFQILSITTTDFQASLTCKDTLVWKFNYNWWAIDDTRVQVINFFDSTTFGQQNISHSNSNAVKGFPSLFSMSYSSAFSFEIAIDEITPTTVNYRITKSGGLKNIGYSIVLVTEDAYSFIERAFETIDYTGALLDLKPNYWLVVPYVGFDSYTNTVQIREYKRYTTTDTTVQYSILHDQINKTSNTFLAAWVGYQFTKQFELLEVQRVNSALYYQNEPGQPFNQIRIIEQQQHYTLFETNTVIIDKQYNIFNIEVINTCNKGKKYVLNFNACNSCSVSQKTKQLTNYCVTMQNMLAYRIRFQGNADYKELILTQSSTGVEITQVLYNQKKTETVIVKIQEFNQ